MSITMGKQSRAIAMLSGGALLLRDRDQFVRQQRIILTAGAPSGRRLIFAAILIVAGVGRYWLQDPGTAPGHRLPGPDARYRVGSSVRQHSSDKDQLVRAYL